ncbi:MAG: tandem-95 repeat protein, partial [Methylococcaceae bacterium]
MITTNRIPTGKPTAVLADGTENTAYTITAATLLQGFSDPDGDTLSVFTLFANHGALSANGGGKWTFTPTGQYSGPVTLNYLVGDGNGGNVDATQSFTLANTGNRIPTGKPTAVLADGTENTAYTLTAATLLQGFRDPDGDALSVFTLFADHGALSANGEGKWTFTPTGQYSGPVTLNYLVGDGKGGHVDATQTFNLAGVADPNATPGYTLTVSPNTRSYPGHTLGEFSNYDAFAVIKDDGSVVTWGDSDTGGDSSAVANQLNGAIDVTQIYSTLHAFAALRADGSVVTWGSSADRGAIPMDSSAVANQINGAIDVTQIYSTYDAFAALRSDGSVVTWGNGSSAVANQINGAIDVTQIYSTDDAFAALRSDGSVVTWGYSGWGGDSSAVATQLNGTIDVTQVFSTDYAFAALRSEGSVVTWGNGNEGGDSSAVATQINGATDVTQIFSTGRAFAALRANGSVVTWGDSDSGGDSSAVASQLNGTIDVKQIFSTGTAFAALRIDGSVVTWGHGNSGGNSSWVAAQINGTVDITQIYSTLHAFAALRGDGSVIAWGGGDYGGADGDSSSVATKLNGAIDVTQIYSTDSAFAALRSDGSVVTWGHGGYGGDSSAVATQLNGATNVTQIYSTDYAFAALRSDGSVVTWGNSLRGGGNSSAVADQLRSGVASFANIYTDDVFHADGAAANHAPSGSVTLSDTTPTQGQTLTAANNLADADGMGVVIYQWQADGVSLGTGKTYTLTASEVGKAITVIAGYTDDHGTAESVASSVTAPVAAKATAAPGFTITRLTDANTGEDGGAVSYAMSLNTQPLRDVTLTFASSNTGEGVLSSNKMAFTPANWDTPQTLTVRGVNDYVDDHDVAYRVTGTVSTIDVDYKLLTFAPLNLVNLDDGRDGGVEIYGDQGGVKADKIQGLDGADTIYGLNMADDLSGGIGNDTLWGGYGKDNLFGEAGDDLLSGEQDEDYLDGGTGSDTLDGGQGVDSMIGGAGNDVYYLGYDAADVITDNGLAGDVDTVIMPYQLNKYTLPGGIENGAIAAGTQNSSLTGNNSDNRLTGNDGNNGLIGAVGRDSLFGGLGRDALFGGDGDDTLDGGNGGDTLDGGAGIDTARLAGAPTDYDISVIKGTKDANSIRAQLIDIDI